MVLGSVGDRGPASYQDPVEPPAATAEVGKINRHPPADAATAAREEGVEVGALRSVREAGAAAHARGDPWA